jgi:AcrR family transcriptional regulator
MSRHEPDATKATTDRILEAAETLLAIKGIRATTLKEITELADVNIAAVNYYFRSKDALVRAVYERSFRPLNEERLRLLEKVEAEADSRGITLEAVLYALFEPMIRAWTTNRNFILLVGRLQNEPDPELSGFIQNQLYAELIRRFLAAAKRAAPDIPEADLFFWIHFLFGGAVYTLLNSQDMERLHPGQNLLDCPSMFLDVLISFGAAGLRSRRITGNAAGARSEAPAAEASPQTVPKR